MLTRRPQLYILLAAMTVFQLVWLLGVWLTGASTNWQRIIGLGVYSVLSAAVVALLPENAMCRLVALKDRLVQDERRWLIGLGVAVLTLGGLYALNQRVWPDEMHTLRASTTVAEQGIAALFQEYGEIPWLARQHPPLMPIINGFVMRLLGVSLMSIRLVSLLFCLAAVIVVYFMGRELYGRETGLLASLVLVSFPLVGRLGTAGLMDVILLFFFTLGLLAVLRLQQNPSLVLALFIGLVIGSGLLVKYHMVFIFPIVGVLFLMRPALRRIPIHLAVVGLVSGVLLGAWLVYASSLGIVAAQQEVVGSVQPSYFVTSDYGLRWMMNSLLTRLPSGIGVYNIPLILLGGLFVVRRHEGRDLFLLAWIVIVSLILVLTIPDHRYFMLTFPALAIIVADWLKSKPELIGRVVLVELLFAGGVLLFMIDWYREAELFVR